jgi:hypothetical protein
VPRTELPLPATTTTERLNAFPTGGKSSSESSISPLRRKRNTTWGVG